MTTRNRVKRKKPQITLNHLKAQDDDYAKTLIRKGFVVRTFCLAHSMSDDTYYGTMKECLEEARRDPPYDGIFEVINFRRKVLYDLDENAKIVSIRKVEPTWFDYF